MKRMKRASDIKVGVIGYGGAFNMGKHHLNEMKKAGMTPVAVAEIDRERLKVAEADFPGIETYPSVAEMLKKSCVNLVAVITPHNTHAHLAIQCLEAGRHVVCEKPLALTTAECNAIIAAAKKRNLVASTYHNRHWDGCIIQALKTIRGGKIGEVFRIEAHSGGWGQPRDWWRASKSISGGILYDWGVHMLEYSLQIFKGEAISEVSGFAKKGFWAPKTAWKDDANEDEATALVRFRSGKWLSLTISSIDSKPKEGMLEVTGTKGTYVMTVSDWKLITHADGTTLTATGRNPPGESWRFYQNVADHLVKGVGLIITAEWARRPIHILDLAGRSARCNSALKAKFH